MKYVVLARPSSLIITDMKRLIGKMELDPRPISHITELHAFKANEVGAVVISTALSSTIKEKYWEVVKKVRELFPGKPIFLASFASISSTRITAGAHFERESLDIELSSVDEINTDDFDPNRQMLILTQRELENTSLLSKISKVALKLINEAGHSGLRY